jgi:biotin transport system ATP-binding protein
MIEASALYCRHPGAETDALEDLSFAVPAGSLHCLLGVNGSGKSTLLALLAGLLAPRSGTLRVCGRDLPAQSAALRGEVAYVPQDPDTYILGSLVEEDLLLGLETDTAGRANALAHARALGLEPLLTRPAHTLSHGQKRSLCLASALAKRPKLLLLDEPFAALDHPSSLGIREALMRNKKDGITQLVAGHDLDLMADPADGFILLAEGKLVCSGDAGSVFPALLASGIRPPCWWPSGTAPAWLRLPS